MATPKKFRVIIPLDCGIKYVDILQIKEATINWLSIYPKCQDFIYGLSDYTAFEMPRMFYIPVNHVSKIQSRRFYQL